MFYYINLFFRIHIGGRPFPLSPRPFLFSLHFIYVRPSRFFFCSLQNSVLINSAYRWTNSTPFSTRSPDRATALVFVCKMKTG